MSPEDQRIAIAIACGWKDINEREFIRNYLPLGNPPDSPGALRPIPDYLNDLNAMHEAEKVLTEKQFNNYYCELFEVVKMSLARPTELIFNATASQRAEAFLKTIGKWKQ